MLYGNGVVSEIANEMKYFKPKQLKSIVALLHKQQLNVS